MRLKMTSVTNYNNILSPVQVKKIVSMREEKEKEDKGEV